MVLVEVELVEAPVGLVVVLVGRVALELLGMRPMLLSGGDGAG